MSDLPQSILCAGRLYCDLVFTGVSNLPQPGSETFADDLSLHAGGGAFITAAAFSALGWNASVLGTLPAAPFDQIVRRDIAQTQVDDSLCNAAKPGDGPQITVAIARDGDRAFLSHKPGAALPEISHFSNRFRHLHIGELRSLIEHPNLIAMARAADMTISLDCGWDDALLSQGADHADLIARVDVFLPNDSEYERLRASGFPEKTADLTVVKCGSNGARCLTPDGWITKSTQPVKVIDATGAGDAFNGGFLSGWLSGETLDTCLATGNQCGAASVRHPGGIGGLADLRRDLSTVQLGAAQ